jgi:hypothetical protein
VIALGHVPARACSCEFCGRVIVAGDPAAGPGVLGTCRECLALGERRRVKAARGAAQEARRRRRAGERFGPAPAGVDVFEGMREEEPMSEAIVRAEVVEGAAMTTMDSAPAAVLAEAQRAAGALRDVIARKPRPVIMGGEQYLEFEDWQTLGRFYGITARVVGDPEFVTFGAARGFRASAEAVHRGEVISRASALCLDDEEKWGSRPKYEWHIVLKDGRVVPESEAPDKGEWKWEPGGANGRNRPKKERVHVGEESVPLYQLASMAQTRACAKTLRNVLSWVAVLAGYRPTPAEEMDGVASMHASPPSRPPAPAREPGEDDVEAPAAAGCPHCGSAELGTARDGRAFCRGCRRAV